MSESSDYSPGVWAGHDFKSAKAVYAGVVSRSYADATAAGKDPDSLVPDTLTCNASAVLTVITDVTGSMGTWPQTIFSKLPYFEHEAQEYLGDDLQIGFGAVGDANSDRYPVQARPYTSGLALKDEMEELIIEGNGGGGGQETYELAALYYARNVYLTNATHPILIMIGDEDHYPYISPDQAKRYAKVILPNRITVEEVFEELMRKYSVYLIRKCYGSPDKDTMPASDRRVHESWAAILGEDRIVNLAHPERVVDVIFGILAKETNRIPYFRAELEDRQEQEKVDIVYRSLATVHAHSAAAACLPKRAGKSTMHKPSDGTKTKSLL